MWLLSILLSMMADWLISTNKFSITTTRKILNSIGQFGPAICLALVSYTGCNRALTVFLLTVGIGLNGAIYSGFKVSYTLGIVMQCKRHKHAHFYLQINHLDISPRFAGILMSFTNCTGEQLLQR